ncbi:Nodulation protein NolA [compost metagenome]
MVLLMEPQLPPIIPGTRWRVGDLAKMTGLTVRTLHHYEAIGLLAAAARGEGGHRLYDEAAVQRLYRIRVLRSLGIALSEIRRFIDDDASLASVMQQHLTRVEQEVEDLTRLRDRLRHICHQPGSHVETAELLRTIDAMSRLERHVGARRQHAAERPPRGVEREWRALADELRACMAAGDDPSTWRARDVALRARERILEFAGHDAAILAALKHLRTADPPAELAGWDPALMAYLDRALQALDSEENALAE